MSTIAAREPLLGATSEIASASACILAEGAQETDKHDAKKVQWKLTVALILCFAFMILEVVGGVIANSLAIMTDAAHLLSDVSGFGVSLFAAWYAARKSQNTHTFGYHRIEVLGALASVLSIWLVTGILVYEAVDRIINPVPVNGKLMFFLALAGCGVNFVNLAVLHDHGHSHGGGGCGGHGHSHGSDGRNDNHGHSHSRENGHSHSDVEAGSAGPSSSHDHGHQHQHEHDEHDAPEGKGNINLRGAMLHIIGDLVQSIGVAAAGALIWWKQDDPRFQLADPICTFVFALLVLFTTRLILQDISDILMERVPRHLDVTAIDEALHRVEGVRTVSDLHVWALKPSIPLLAAHVTLEAGADPREVMEDVTSVCRRQGIAHSTIQVLLPDLRFASEPAEASVVAACQGALFTIQVDEEGHGPGCQTMLPPLLQRVPDA